MKFTIDMSQAHVSIRANEGLAQITWFHQIRFKNPEMLKVSWVNLYLNFTLRIKKKPLYKMQDNPYRRIKFIKDTIWHHVSGSFEVSFTQFAHYKCGTNADVTEYIVTQADTDRIISAIGEEIIHYINSNL